ncbi:MAG: glycosyltransferase family 9 protein [Acidimicrobiia bacterium]
MIGPGDPGTVVVLRALGLGDLCTGVPALRALRRRFPHADLVLAAPAWQEPLARLAGVDRVVDTAPLAPLDPSLHGADLAVNLHGRGPQSTSLLAASRPGALVAFAHPEADATPVADVTWRADEHEVHRWCRLLEESGIPADPADLDLPRPRPRSASPALATIRRRIVETTSDGADETTARATNRRRIAPEGLAVVHPGAAAAGRRWPAERFGAVVAELVARGHLVALTGSEDEWHLCQRVLDAAGPLPVDQVEVLAGRTGLLELATVVAEARLVVANDTGVAHLATAFAVPSVVLFGPTPPGEWGPPPVSRHRTLWAGRRGDPHADELDPGLAAIGIDDVIAAIDEVTARVPA